MIVERSARARGRVQGVMFRQTFVRGLLKRGLEGGASNSPGDRREVTVTLSGEAEMIEEVIARMRREEPLNSWGAHVESVELLDEVIPIEQHQVTTANVDDFPWSTGVDFYL
ncbi:MAG: acylphosphatase [Planctomycetota bacterium]